MRTLSLLIIFLKSVNTLRHRHQDRLRVILFLTSIWHSFAFCYSYTGRITLGSYIGRERLAEPSAGDFTNDVATASGRFFVRVTDISRQKFELVSDIRDKNDFFGLVDKERLQLTNSNTLQVRQLSGKYPGEYVFCEIGRFPVPEAGTAWTDGFLTGVNLAKTLRWAGFLGYNPKRPEQTFVQFNSNSQIFGTYLTWTPPYQGRGISFSSDIAVTSNIVQSQTDRLYLYTYSNFYWGPQSSANLLTYLDFVPNTYLQNGTLNLSQEIAGGWVGRMTLLSIDVLEYQRRQNIRSQLSSSPYREIMASAHFNSNAHFTFEAQAAYGNRTQDGLFRRHYILKAGFPRLLGKRWDAFVSAGLRKNFISDDTLFEGGISYESKDWQLSLDEAYAIEKYRTGDVYHPLISELSISHILENALYGTFSLQDIIDERVHITSFFLKLTYRFGSQEIPPVRDGAPPMGRL